MSSYDLVVLNGPLEGTTVQLKTSERLVLGRSARGLQFVDPLVSLVHAEISWEGDRYWLQDKGSATGTYVNDVRLTDRAVQLVPGMRIRLGETDLEVREHPRSIALRLVGAAAAVFILVLGVRSLMESIEVHYDPIVRWFEPVHQGAGYAAPDLRVPTEFIRAHGVDHRELVIDQVTDFDNNGIDELWLSWPKGREVTTFNPDGSWRTMLTLRKDCRFKGRQLAEGLPAECYQRSRIATDLPEACGPGAGESAFPDLDCTGTTYRYKDGRYSVVGQEGIYAWMPPTQVLDRGKVKDRVVAEGPPEPSQFSLIRESELAGFLIERGVVEPIHYLICEDAVRDIRAQVLTQGGEIVPLSVGCIGDVVVDGPTRYQEFGDGIPRMFAFTGTGYEALLEDLAVYLSGSTDLLFMSQTDRAVYDKVAGVPLRRRGGIRIAFQGPERILEPIAEEEKLPGEVRRLLAAEFTSEPPPLSDTILLEGPGRYDLKGCGEIEVEMSDWHCLFTKGCSGTSRFLTVQVVGCDKPGPVLNVPYARGLTGYADGRYEGRVAIESLDVDGQIDVLRARFAYREARGAAP